MECCLVWLSPDWLESRFSVKKIKGNYLKELYLEMKLIKQQYGFSMFLNLQAGSL